MPAKTTEDVDSRNGHLRARILRLGLSLLAVLLLG